MPAEKKPKDAIQQAHEDWFFNLDSDMYIQLQKEWNDRRLDVKLKRKKNYDEWLNYFKTLSPNAIRLLAKTGTDILTTEGYAALSRWHDIISNPAHIDKIHQAGLSNKRGGKSNSTVIALAQANDRLGVLKATRDKIAEKLDKGAGNRDTALLTAQMTEIMTQIAEQERREGPKKNTKLGALLEDMPEMLQPRARGKGARNTSFKSRVTIEDVEGLNE